MPDRIFPTYSDDFSKRFRPLAYPYVFLATWLAFGYIFGDSIRTNTPSFGGAKELASIHIWGFMFLAGAVALLVSSFMHNTKWLRLALFLGGVIYMWWGILFAFTVFDVPFASLNAPGLYAFISFAHFAAASLPQRALPTERVTS